MGDPAASTVAPTIDRLKHGSGLRRYYPPPHLLRPTWGHVVGLVWALSSWRDRNQLWEIIATSAWIEQPSGNQDLFLSVILPTHNRAKILPRAIESVLRQVHQRWELIVVDDLSSDRTADIVSAYSDPRIEVVKGPGLGPAAARNTGLAVARGDVVAYLDDDNCLDRLWLRGVAWAFTHYPDTLLLYGARVVLDTSFLRRPMLPELQFPRFRRWWLKRSNFIDIGMVAHRRNLAGARFNEAVPPPHEDWDLILRLTHERPPLRLPLISTYYFTDAPQRQTELQRQVGG